MAKYENLTSLEGLAVGDTVEYTPSDITDELIYPLETKRLFI